MQREEDLVTETRLYAKGRSMSEIAATIGVSAAQVCEDLQLVRRRWREESIASIDEQIADELAQINLITREAWAHYERSQRGDRDGRHELLDTLLKCSEQRRRLLGLDAERPIDVTTYLREEAIKHGLDPDRAIIEARALMLSGANG